MTKRATSIDPGVPPDSVTQQQAALDDLMSESKVNAEMSKPVVSYATPKNPSSVTDTGTSITPTPPVFTWVCLTHKPKSSEDVGFSISFYVEELCIQDNFVSLLVTSDFNFRPAGPMDFELEWDDKKLPVLFLGAEFKFPSRNVRGISFLVDRKK